MKQILARLAKAKTRVQAFMDVTNFRLGMSQSVLGLTPHELPLNKGMVRNNPNGSVTIVKIGSVGKPETINLAADEVAALKRFL